MDHLADIMNILCQSGKHNDAGRGPFHCTTILGEKLNLSYLTI